MTSNRFPRAQSELLNIFTLSQTEPAKPSAFLRNTPRQAAFLLMPGAPPAPTSSEAGPNPSVNSSTSRLFLAVQTLLVTFHVRSQAGVSRLADLQAKTAGRADHVPQSRLQMSPHFPPARRARALCPLKSLSLANDTNHRAALAADAQRHQIQGVGNEY